MDSVDPLFGTRSLTPAFLASLQAPTPTVNPPPPPPPSPRSDFSPD